jgi:hypothetical protein
MKINKNEKIAEVVGLSFGDGSLTLKKSDNALRFQLRGDAEEEREHYLYHIIPLFNKYVSQPLIKRNVSVVESKKSHRSFGMAIQNNIVGTYLNSVGIPVGRKNELIIPKWIKNDKTFSIAFLRGILDTDGTIFCKRNYSLKIPKKHTQIKLKIVTISKLLSQDLQLLMNSLKIKNYLKVQTSKRSNEKTSYHVEVSGGINVDKWFNIIGSNSPKHITKFQVWKEFGFCPPYTKLKQRKKFLTGELNPNKFYGAGVPETLER